VHLKLLLIQNSSLFQIINDKSADEDCPLKAYPNLASIFITSVRPTLWRYTNLCNLIERSGRFLSL